MSFNPFASLQKAALRRAIIGVNPDYFSWSVEEQEKYRVSMPDEDDFRITQALLKALFQLEVNTQQEMRAVFDAFSDEKYLRFNSTVLPLQGIGEDCFYLNDWLGEGKTLLDFETLHEYDYDDHYFQEQARQKDFPDYVVKPYRGSLYYRWAHLFIDGDFYYANLSMAAGYLYGMLDGLGLDKIQEQIPYEYVDGPEHGKRDGKGTIWDLKLDAGGMEAQLQELQDRYYRYTMERQEALSREFDEKAQKRVYLIERSHGNEPYMDFVFTDKTALQAVRFRHFMSDCRNLLGDSRELEALVQQERRAALDFLEAMHQDILHNFDPKVVKFRKKRKIVVADGALKDLQ